MNDTTRQVGGALGVAVLGTILNAVYLGQINQVQWPIGLSPQVLDAVQSSVQGALLAAQNVASQNPVLAQTIVTNAKEAFTTGAIQASVVATIVLAVASLATYFILPSRVKPPEEVDGEITPDMKDDGE